MSDMFGKLRSIMADPSPKCELSAYVGYDFDREIALAQILIDHPEQRQEGLQYLGALNSPDINMGVLYTYVDLHPQNGVLEPHHFHWTETPSEQSRFNRRAPLSDTCLQSKFHFEELEYWPSGPCFIRDRFHTNPDPFSSLYNPENVVHKDEAAVEKAEDFTTALRQAYAHKTFYEPGNMLYQYQAWIRKGRKPSQFGLLCPQEISDLKLQITQEQLESIHAGTDTCRREERWGKDPWQEYIPRIDDDFSRFGMTRSLGTQDPQAFIYTNYIMDIRVPLSEAQTVSALTKYVKQCLLDAWEYMETRDLPFMAVMPPELFFNTSDFYELAHADELAQQRALWTRRARPVEEVVDGAALIDRLQQQIDAYRASRDNE